MTNGLHQPPNVAVNAKCTLSPKRRNSQVCKCLLVGSGTARHGAMSGVIFAQHETKQSELTIALACTIMGGGIHHIARADQWLADCSAYK